MEHLLHFTGDINLMHVVAPEVPFGRVTDTLKEADIRFGNLECCLYAPSTERSLTDEGFYASPAAGQALSLAGFDAVGTANNVNFGPDAIRSSLAELDKLGISHTGSGVNSDQAHAPAILERNGLRFGFVQRTSVYWPVNHEAGEHSAGVAVIRGHTSYQLPLHQTRREIPPANRPGVPPEILTWADPKYLSKYRNDIADLKSRTDIVIASHHWGLSETVLQYMTEIAHAAIDAGADIVIGHGPHYSLPVELYKGKPIFYGLGSFSFHTGHGGLKHGDWVGMLGAVTLDGKDINKVSFRFARHNDKNETILCEMKNEQAALARMAERSAQFGTLIKQESDRAIAYAAS